MAAAVLAVLLIGGCSHREPRFDIVPAPISIRDLWLGGLDSTDQSVSWECIDAARGDYLRNYVALVQRSAVPLARDFRELRSEGWRQDPELIERFTSRQGSMLAALEVLDEGLIGRIESCGLDGQRTMRLRIDRRIARARSLIEGHGPAILDLRHFVPVDAARRPEVMSLLDVYAAELATVLATLQDAERQRLARIARIRSRLEAEDAQRVESERRSSKDLTVAAEAEAAVPVRKALSRVLDLDLRTLTLLQPQLPADASALLERALFDAIDSGAGAPSGEPGPLWQAEVIAATEQLAPSERRELRDRIEKVRERDLLLRHQMLETMRRGNMVPADDPRRAERERQRKELLAAALGKLPEAERQTVSTIFAASPADFESAVRSLAPLAADRLLERCPAHLRPTEPEPSLLRAPDSPSSLFRPHPLDEGRLETLLERARIDADSRVVARQLWRDHAAMAIESVARLSAAVEEAERELRDAFPDAERAVRAFDLWIQRIDEERRTIAAAEENFFDALDPLLSALDARERTALRLERRLERERVDWRSMPLSEAMGLGPMAEANALDALHAADLDEVERAIADEVLRHHLPDLIVEAAGFRGEGIATVRRLVALITRLRLGARDDAAFTQALTDLSRYSRAPLDRHHALHRAVVDEVAALLPQQAQALRRAWRREIYPELFLDDAPVTAIVEMARATAPERVAASIDAWNIACDEREQALMEARREAISNEPVDDREAFRARMRAHPALAAARAMRVEEHARLLRDLARASDDERVTRAVDAWMRSARPRHYLISE